mgnify:CR=1 FL=1
MAADTTTLTEKMRAALRISSTSEKITEEINDCIAACTADMKNDGVKVIKETDGLIIRAITLYCKAEFGFNNAAEQFRKSYDALKMRLSLSAEYNTAPQVSETDTNSTESKAVEWLDELTLIAETTAENRVNKNGFAVKPEESTRTVFCNKKSVGYSEYFKSQQTGKLVEAKYEVHKADYGGEDVVEVNGRRYFVLKTYDTGTDTIELTLTDLRHRNEV